LRKLNFIAKALQHNNDILSDCAQRVFVSDDFSFLCLGYNLSFVNNNFAQLEYAVRYKFNNACMLKLV